MGHRKPEISNTFQSLPACREISKGFLVCLASACRGQTFHCQKLNECLQRIVRTSIKHFVCKFGLFQCLNHPILPNRTRYIEIIFKLANNCSEKSFLSSRRVGGFHHFGSNFLRAIYSILNASVILERNENLLARNETRLAGNENCLARNETRLARNETRGGNLHLSGTVPVSSWLAHRCSRTELSLLLTWRWLSRPCSNNILHASKYLPVFVLASTVHQFHWKTGSSQLQSYTVATDEHNRKQY